MIIFLLFFQLYIQGYTKYINMDFIGFIATGDSLAPGNLGLKDQVIALRWIQRNIVAFGGDPNSVTISGCSVGGLSTFLHMLSPMSKNLFHRVIDMSGSPLLTEPYPTHQRDIAEKQAKLLNCPINNTKDMLACLRSKPVANFTKTISEFFVSSYLREMISFL